MTIGEEQYQVKLGRAPTPGGLVVEISGKPMAVTLSEVSAGRIEFVLDGERISFQRPAPAASTAPPPPTSASGHRGVVQAPMPGKVTAALVKPGDRVKKGDPLVVLESMKMEVAVRADQDAAVREVLTKEGASVKRGQDLVRLGPS